LNKNILFQFLSLTIAIVFSGCFETESAKDLYQKNSKNEIVLIYIGSTTCSVCLDDSNKRYFEMIYNGIEDVNDDSRYSVKKIGISIGNNRYEDFSFLNEFSVPFDEISISHDNFNTGMIRYVFDNFKGEPVVPQVIILKRIYHQNIIGDSPVNTSIESENLLYRLVGLPSMERFADNSNQINYANFFVE